MTNRANKKSKAQKYQAELAKNKTEADVVRALWWKKRLEAIEDSIKNNTPLAPEYYECPCCTEEKK